MSPGPVQLRIESVQTITGIECVFAGMHPARIPPDPDGTARPRAWPGSSVGRCNTLCVVGKESDVRLQEQHVWVTQSFRFFACPLPELQEVLEGKNALRDVLADTDIPAIILSDMKAERVRPDHRTNTHVPVAKQHAFKELRPRTISYDQVAARDLEAVKQLLDRGRSGAQRQWKRFSSRDQSRRLQEVPASWFHDNCLLEPELCGPPHPRRLSPKGRGYR